VHTHLSALADDLHQRHRGAQPLVLPNAWDAASAHAVVSAGFDALATSGRPASGTTGGPEREAFTPEGLFLAVSRVAAAVPVPVTVDLGRGWGLEPGELVDRLLEAGAVGCTLEDSDPDTGDMVGLTAQALWLGEVRRCADAAGVRVVLNARIDLWLDGREDPRWRLGRGLERAYAYADAGVDCVCPLGIRDEGEIAAFVRESPVPVNVLLWPGSPSLERLSAMGVSRIGFGGNLYRETRDRLGWRPRAVREAV
jgi:2-methylisocitrate lyase-like PEP mutase family enzyme